jgi:hypothetical protein
MGLPGQQRGVLLALLALLWAPPPAGSVPKAADPIADAAGGSLRATPRAAHVDRSVAEVAGYVGVQSDDAFGSLLEMFDGDQDGVLTFDELSELKELLLGPSFGPPARGTPLPDLVRTQGLTDMKAWRDSSATGGPNDSTSRSAVEHDQFIERFGALLPDAEATFAALDADRDGALGAQEFVRLHEHVPPTMDYASFSKWYHMKLARTEDGGAALYKALDLDGDELLSAAEIARMNDALRQQRARSASTAPNPLKRPTPTTVAGSSSVAGQAPPGGNNDNADNARRSKGGMSAEEWVEQHGGGGGEDSPRPIRSTTTGSSSSGSNNRAQKTPIDLSTAPDDTDYSRMLQAKGWLDLGGATVRKDLEALFPLLDADGDGVLAETEQAAFELLMTESGVGPVDPYANPLSAAAARRGELPLLHQLLLDSPGGQATAAAAAAASNGDGNNAAERVAVGGGLDVARFARLFRVLLGAELAPLLSGEAQQAVLDAPPRGFGSREEGDDGSGPADQNGGTGDGADVSTPDASTTEAGVYATADVDRRAVAAAAAVDLAQVFASLDADGEGQTRAPFPSLPFSFLSFLCPSCSSFGNR